MNVSIIIADEPLGYSQESFYINTLYLMNIALSWITSLFGPFCVRSHSLTLALSFRYIFPDWSGRSIWKQRGVQLSSVHGEVQALAESVVCDPQTRPTRAVHVRCAPGMWTVSLCGTGVTGTEGGEETLNSQFSYHSLIEQESSVSPFHYNWGNNK